MTDSSPTTPPIYSITMQKMADKGTIPDHPIYTGYAIRGYAAALPVVGEVWTVLRTERNGVSVVGITRTSPVTAVVHDAAKQEVVFHTLNSTYRFSYILDTRQSILIEAPVDSSP